MAHDKDPARIRAQKFTGYRLSLKTLKGWIWDLVRRSWKVSIRIKRVEWPTKWRYAALQQCNIQRLKVRGVLPGVFLTSRDEKTRLMRGAAQLLPSQDYSAHDLSELQIQG